MTDRWLLVLRTTHVGSTLLSLPAGRAVASHLGRVGGEVWICHPTGSTSEAASLDIWRHGVPLGGTIARGPRPVDYLALVMALRRHRFSTAMLLNQNRLGRLSAFRYRAWLGAGGIRRLIGVQASGATTSRDPSVRPSVHVAQQRLALVAQCGVPLGPGSLADAARLPLPVGTRDRARAWLTGAGWQGQPLAAVGPGATAASNRWPIDHFVAVGRALFERGYEIVVCGGPAERAAGDALCAAWGRGLNAAGALPILDSAALLSLCRALVGLDTGTTHLAAAVGTPCIVVQGGRTRPGTWDPLGDHHQVLRFDVPCAGCGLMACPISRHPCMRGLTPEDVIAAWDRLPGGPAPRPSTVHRG